MSNDGTITAPSISSSSQNHSTKLELPGPDFGDTSHSSPVTTSGTGFGAQFLPGASSESILQTEPGDSGSADFSQVGKSSAWGVPDPCSSYEKKPLDKFPGNEQQQHEDSEDVVTLWRGLRNTNVTDLFSQIGGTEMAFMSTTSDIKIAGQYSMSPDSLLFKIVNDSFMSIGADIDWLSTFPGEREFLYPPLTYLKPTGRVASDISIKKGREVFNFTVVEVKPFMG